MSGGGEMEIFDRLVIPEVTFPLIGILGLLFVWQYYQAQVLAGRIYALDFWDITGVRMFMHVTTGGDRACEHCQAAQGTVFLPSILTQKDFSTLAHPCTNGAGCRCLIVGLYGGWPEADRVVHLLRQQSRRKPYKLSYQELLEVFEGPWHRSVVASADRLTIHMVQAMLDEHEDMDSAIVLYHSIVDQAKGARDLRLLVPAYLRLTELLEQAGRHEEALAMAKRFDKRFPRRRRAFYYPTENQRATMVARQFRLLSHVRQQRAVPSKGRQRDTSLRIAS
jgi:hypothetical protein